MFTHTQGKYYFLFFVSALSVEMPECISIAGGWIPELLINKSVN